jgi:hypothetical protein
MSTSRSSDRMRSGLAARLLACLLTALAAVQPVAHAACAPGESVSGGEPCCCSARTVVAETSCCSTAAPGGDVAASILGPIGRCACALQAPVPFAALPRESGVRGVERGQDRGIARWIESGALASASIPLVGWASTAAARVSLPAGVRAPGLPIARAHRPRELLDLICVARC